MRRLGADRMVDYRTRNAVETGIQYDMVVDTVGALL